MILNRDTMSSGYYWHTTTSSPVPCTDYDWRSVCHTASGAVLGCVLGLARLLNGDVRECDANIGQSPGPGWRSRRVVEGKGVAVKQEKGSNLRLTVAHGFD